MNIDYFCIDNFINANMLIMKYIFIAFILVINFGSILFGQNSISIDSYQKQRGVSFAIPLNGSINNATLNSIEITIRFNSTVLAINKVEAGSEFAIQDANPEFNVDFKNFTNSELVIKSNQVKSISNGQICKIVVEGLAASDTVSGIEPILLKINDVVQTDVQFSKGMVTINSTPIQPIFINGLSSNYPNPFSEKTKFNFSFENQTELKFSIFSNGGREVFNYPNSQQSFEVKFFDSKNNLIQIPENNKLMPGNYYVEIAPIPWEVTAGVYYFVLYIGSDAFKENIIYIK